MLDKLTNFTIKATDIAINNPITSLITKLNKKLTIKFWGCYPEVFKYCLSEHKELFYYAIGLPFIISSALFIGQYGLGLGLIFGFLVAALQSAMLPLLIASVLAGAFIPVPGALTKFIINKLLGIYLSFVVQGFLIWIFSGFLYKKFILKRHPEALEKCRQVLGISK
jgi:hypothetical protein